jgi:hypothetical protein
MVDVTIIGGGPRARDCGEVLSRSGFSLAHSFEVDTGSRSPIVLGEVQGAFQLAREAMETGRHLLIAGTQVLTPERLTLLLERRRQAQALFVWSDRRHHPGYRFVAGLMESDNTWRPRYLRQEVLSTDQPSSVLFRWRTLEAIAVLTGITGTEPKTVNASAIVNAKRNAPDLASLSITYKDVEAQLLVGLGEAVERRETLMASASRKAYVDELNSSMPIRIIDDEPVNANSARWLRWRWRRPWAAPAAALVSPPQNLICEIRPAPPSRGAGRIYLRNPRAGGKRLFFQLMVLLMENIDPATART